jgi:hypothetical protein
VPAPESERLSPSFVRSAEQERLVLGQRVKELRQRADELREQADELDVEAKGHERLVRELEDVLGIAAQIRLDLPQGQLGGRHLREVAIDVLRQHELDEPVHYTEWYELVRAAGHRIAGKDPVATFLAQISRDPNVERIGRKTGRYRLRPGIESNGRPAATAGDRRRRA